MVAAWLVRGHLRTRWKRYTVVTLAIAVGLFGFYLVGMVAAGTQAALTAPIEAAFSGDVRVTKADSASPSEQIWVDYRDVAADLGAARGVHVSPRFESYYLTVVGEEYESWGAGALVGVDPLDVREQEAILPYVRWGAPATGISVYDPATDRAYTPILIGRPMVDRLNLTLAADETPDFSQVLTLTSGRLVGGPGGAPFPITIECVVVGVFETGLHPLDRFTAFLPVQAVRVLMGYQENDPVANVLVVRDGDAGAARAIAIQDLGVQAHTAHEFAFQYLGAVFAVLYAAAVLVLALFLAVLLVWITLETSALIRNDLAVISSLRAVGIPVRDIHLGYVVLVAGSVLVAACVAVCLAALAALFLPPIPVRLQGFTTSIPWHLNPFALLGVVVATVTCALATAFLAGRRITQGNILQGLRGG